MRRPPSYAWDWFCRQRLLWREAHRRLVAVSGPQAIRYRGAETKSDVLALLRDDLPRDAVVADVVRRTVADVAFLGRTEGRFEDLGLRAPPRGLRWWWTAVTGQEARPPVVAPPPRRQLTIEDVFEGYGG